MSPSNILVIKSGFPPENVLVKVVPGGGGGV